MIDYSKLQVQILKDLCRDEKITNIYSVNDNSVYLSDSHGYMFVKIPNNKFILDINKLRKRECNGFEKVYINYTNFENVTDTYTLKFSNSVIKNRTCRVFLCKGKECYVDEKLLKIIGYSSDYIVKRIPNKKGILLFYVDDKLIGGIMPVMLN